ncbi:Periplasmic component of ABC-type transport system [Sterolibacterium denitrificans]|uniref:Periplasmic component of ABC-type transport system n=1 Tax=Sterolibacterium denitrificans TaxID=157592 RepID=A0A7Z7HQK0_9PROT|nr:MlaD family protein [Sterolibacterium denitrificans]SMB25310.1 Periplasmic component of ABC-type transport system [Sterolibacterium denitrificans]
MENRAHALAAGLFVIVFGLALVLVAWWFGGTRTLTRDLLLVTQYNVNGLNPLAPVRFRGMKAGKVISITLDPQNRQNILVLVRVDADLPLSTSTTAQLNSQGITGLSYVQLDDNAQSAELLPLNDKKPPRIPLRQTLMDALGDQASDIVGQIGILTANLNRVLNEENLQHLNRTMKNLEAASDGLRELPQLVAAARAVLSAENLQRVQNILVHLERTAGESAPLAVEMRALVASMQSLSTQLEAMTGAVGSELVTTSLPRFNGLMGDLQENSRQMRNLLEGLETTPQALLFGYPAPRPGPGERGFEPHAR